MEEITGSQIRLQAEFWWTYISDVCKKAPEKLNVFVRITPFKELFKRRWTPFLILNLVIVSLLISKIWDMLPDDCKNIDNLITFKNKAKKWKPEKCPGRLCKIYINNAGFVWERKKAWNIQLVFLELWLLLASIVFLPINMLLFLPF